MVDPSHIFLGVPQPQKFTEGPSAAPSTKGTSGEGTKKQEAEELADVASRGDQLTQVRSPKYWVVLWLVDLKKSQRKEEDGYIKTRGGDTEGKTEGRQKTFLLFQSLINQVWDFSVVFVL